MSKLTRKTRLTLLCAVCAVLGISAGAVAFAATHHSQRHRLLLPKAHRASTFASVTPGPHQFTRANGLDPSAAEAAGTSSVVGDLKVVRGNGVACVLYDEGGDHCLSDELVNEGRDVNVRNGCGTSDHGMAIFGVAPSGTAKVTLAWSDGSSSSATVSNGVYLFDGTTPQSAAPYPTSLAWVGSDGSTLSSSRFPIGPKQFCPGS